MMFLDFSSRCLNSVFLGFNRSIVVHPKVDSVSTRSFSKIEKYLKKIKRILSTISKILYLAKANIQKYF
ncbi:hypothetical protein RBB68_12785 [Leptospira interrogans]|uniref:hypothetical protein n=1 Tax=Leptospira interrogans TaxID=173 RepID=UPI0002D6BECE|nr:hypothetical protein [Leptospira interrogans]WML93277.1 hypothetical protein RBB68_12785 [Leptospira interrogans]